MLKGRLYISRLVYNLAVGFGLFLLFIFFLEGNRLYKLQREEQNKALFEKSATIFSEKIGTFIHGLQGIGGLYHIKNFEVTPNEIHDYAIFRNNFINFKGALGYGFIRVVKEKEIPAYLKQQKKFYPDFHIKKMGNLETTDLYIVETIEPISTNSSAIGLVMNSEAGRKKAAIDSIESGHAMLTSKIHLVQNVNNESGFIYLLPIYETVTVPEKIADRVKEIKGWAFCPITLSSLIGPLTNLTDNLFSYELYDITNPSHVDLLYKNKKILLSTKAYQSEVIIGGRTFLLKGESVVKGLLILDILTIIFFLLSGFLYTFLLYKLRFFLNSRHVIEERVSIAENWNRAVIDSSTFSIISTLPNGIITTFNYQAEVMLGYKSEELVGLKTPQILHVEEEVISRAQELSKELGLIVTPGFEVFTLKAKLRGQDSNLWTYVKKDGSTIPIKLNVSCIKGANNEILGYLGLAEDISYQIELNQKIENQKIQLVHNAKMISLGEMAGGVAHEINTPLTVILNKTRKQLQNLKSTSVDHNKLIEDLEKIDMTVLKIAKIINGLKTFSRNSEMDSMVEANLENIVSDTLEFCKEIFKFKNVNLKISGSLNYKIKCRPAQISQVFLNLFNNSLDAIENLESKWIEIKCEKNYEHIILSFTDSGNGIEKNIVDKLMEPFFTTKEVGKGTGLGLSISLGIIKEHGGDFYFDETSQHTRFIVKFPDHGLN